MLIGEIAELSGLSARMLRHYDSIGLVSPSARTTGGYRQYSDEDIERLFHVEGLRALGLGLREIADALGDLSFAPTAMVEALIIRTRDRLAREEELLRNLEQVQASAPADWSDALRTIGLIRGLASEHASERQRLALAHDHSEHRSIVPVVEAALTETDANAAGALDWALAQAGDTAVPLLAAALNAPSATRRHRAAEALRKIGSPTATEALAAAIHHTDPAVRGRAALERGMRGEADAIPVLLELIVEGRDDVSASDALADLASRSGLADIVAQVIDVELARASDQGRRRLTQSLADILGEQAAATLRRLAGDVDRDVSLTARYLLERRGSRG